MRRIFFVTALLILFTHVCYASTLDKSVADSQARQSFTLRSVEGKIFDVRIVGDGETVLTDWLWGNDDTIYAADYSAYLGDANSDTLTRQDVELFANNYGGEHPQRINVTRPNRDGFYKIMGVNGLPDLLVSQIQVTGGGYFDMKIFVVKSGRLQLVRFLDDDKKTLRESFNTYSKPATYLDDGTLSIPWHTNAMPAAGSYETVYMFDADNLILIPAYTKKTWSPRQN